MSLATENEILECKQSLLQYINFLPVQIQNIETRVCKYNRGIIITEEERITLLKWAIDVLDISKKYTFKRLNYYCIKKNQKISF